MAFLPTFSRNASKHVSAYGTVLDRFLVSHSPSSSSSSASLFEPTKSPTTGCWAPPKYSLRRQAKLVKEAALTGQLSVLPDGPRTARVTQRLQRLAQSHALEQTASQYAYVPQDTPAQPARPTALGQRAVKHHQRVSQEEKQEALSAARRLVREVGPYKGRARVFKGSRVDKGKARRGEDVKGKLGGMEQTVRDWQSGQTEARNKMKPGLPF